MFNSVGMTSYFLFGVILELWNETDVYSRNVETLAECKCCGCGTAACPWTPVVEGGRGPLQCAFLSQRPAPFATAISWLSQNALCLRALAWNKTMRACMERMGALSQLPFTLSGGIETELKESVWLQISTAQGSMLCTLIRTHTHWRCEAWRKFCIKRRWRSLRPLVLLNSATFQSGAQKIISSRLFLSWLVFDRRIWGCLVCKWCRVWICD